MPPAVRRCVALVCACALVNTAVAVVGVATARPAAGQQPAPVTYTTPVAAPVVDPFRAPASPYGPGHRGLTYATAPGDEVDAAGAGTVVFAGPVAGAGWITISHDDGVRTTYGPMQTIAVTTGEVVRAGDRIGTAGGPLVFTARIGDAYVDPALLVDAGGAGSVHLVRDPADLASYPSYSFGDAGLSPPGLLTAAAEWGRDRLFADVDALEGATPVPLVFDAVDALVDWHERGSCTSASTDVPPVGGRRIALLVAGLGSSSTAASIDDLDAATLGYAPGDVVRFSYRGGRVPVPGALSPDLDRLGTSSYGPRDTTGDLAAAGERLADLLAATVGAAPPGVVVDVYAHSQGGLVTRLALADLAARDPGVVARLGVVALLGTPNQGAELAATAGVLARDPIRAALLDAAASAGGLEIRADDPVVSQLAPGSALLDRLAAQPPPAGPTYLSIAARGDLVVPSPDAQLDGATNVVVDLTGLDAHAALPGSAAVTRELDLALAGLPASCESAADAVVDRLWGDVVRNGERFVTATRGP